MGDQQTSIRISCDTRDTLPFSEIEEFQGNLKKRSKKEISKIITSILGGVTKKYASIKATGKSDIISYAHNYQTDLSPLQ